MEALGETISTGTDALAFDGSRRMIAVS